MGDPIPLICRLAAIYGAGRVPPDDLARETVDWVSAAAAAILAGAPADEALGLRVRPGARSVATRYKLARRDDALTRLYGMATGGQVTRGESVLRWLEARQSRDPVEPELVPLLDDVLSAGARIPENGASVARIARTRVPLSPVVRPGGDCATLDHEAPHIAASGTTNG